MAGIVGVRRWLGGAMAAIMIVGAGVPASAVVILDSTWKKEKGGGPDTAGFGAALRLAAEPQFRAVLSLSSDGESWGEASGTWIGNDERYAYILTAGHIYDLPAKIDDYVVRGPGGRTLTPDRLWIHPRWNGDPNNRGGYDVAIMRLSRPLDGLGPQPVLYEGDGESGRLITFVGYGSRGIGSVGEDDRFYEDDGKAAAQGVVDEWFPLKPSEDEDEDVGNFLGVYLPREDGKVPNPFGGATKPATPLIGLLGSGDSGGSAWMPLGAEWVVVGVNSSGDGDAKYGESSWFCRVSAHRDWIRKIYPGARFAR
jgi:hypothetical protein